MELLLKGTLSRQRSEVRVSSSPPFIPNHLGMIGSKSFNPQLNPMNPSERIDQLIAELTDWRGKTFASIRKSILEADREIIEEWKWMGSLVWSHDGIISVANAHKHKLNLTLSHRATLPHPH